MRDHFFDAKRCDRCGADLSGGRIMSMFNTQVICMAYSEKERQREDYQQAVKADVEAIKRGDLNFPGIGLKKR